ncbi:N-acetyltransferase [Amylibacter ulvae]|uniref:N-acetyltransferase n=1 Tax=Paramylibacter ulvae TaxID=1651968 RepID=A0ABQ3D439_9RHOB|nr:GNAT family N-acetyltransferase [Amylibacter ulvae]GHA57723.1 N-acetyltransferase [Amylibacter ulvae]
MSHVIETERLILRAPVAKDWDQFQPFAMSERAVGIGGPHDLGKAFRTFAAEIGHWEIRGYGMFAVTERGNGTALGLIGPWYPADWPEAELAWMVWGQSEGKGIAYEAAAATRDFAFDVLGWDTAVSYVGHGVDRSAALARRLGAEIDTLAATPNGKPCQVFRHPNPKQVAA